MPEPPGRGEPEHGLCHREGDGSASVSCGAIPADGGGESGKSGAADEPPQYQGPCSAVDCCACQDSPRGSHDQRARSPGCHVRVAPRCATPEDRLDRAHSPFISQKENDMEIIASLATAVNAGLAVGINAVLGLGIGVGL